jgi:hypothetical protein
MDTECNVICDECGHDFPADQSMPHPEDDTGDFCFECFVDLEYKWNVKRGAAWLKINLPTADEFLAEYRKVAKAKNGTLESMEGNCHGAAMALVNVCKAKGLDIELQRGHWLGTDVRAERSEFPMQQHSWTRMSVPDNQVRFIVDPTQWVFVGGSPTFGITDEDDKRYDLGSYTIRKAFCDDTIPARSGKTKKSGLSKKAQEWLNNISPRDWSVWTDQEMIKIANFDPRGMMHIKEVWQAIIKAGNIGFIPLDGRTMVGL